VMASMAAAGIVIALAFPRGSVEHHAHDEVKTVNSSD